MNWATNKSQRYWSTSRTSALQMRTMLTITRSLSKPEPTDWSCRMPIDNKILISRICNKRIKSFRWSSGSWRLREMTRGSSSPDGIRIKRVRMWKAKERGHLNKSIITSTISRGIKGRKSREDSSTRLEEEQKLGIMMPRMAWLITNQTSSRIKRNTKRGNQINKVLWVIKIEAESKSNQSTLSILETTHRPRMPPTPRVIDQSSQRTRWRTLPRRHSKTSWAQAKIMISSREISQSSPNH